MLRRKIEKYLLEWKAVTGNAKSAKTILKHYDKYHVKNLIKLGDYNIGFNDSTLTLPLYMGFLINDF